MQKKIIDTDKKGNLISQIRGGNAMRKNRKNVIAAAAVVAIGVGVASIFGLKSRASERFDRDACINYASEHYDDGKGLCSEFASDALEAAGLNCWSRSASSLHAQLMESGLGEEYIIPLESNGTVRIGNY